MKTGRDRRDAKSGTAPGNTAGRMGKKIWLRAAAALLCAVLLGSAALAAEPGRAVIDSGSSGGLSWTLYEGGELRISGQGRMPDYREGAAPWSAQRGGIRTAVLEPGVTAIGEGAFTACAALTDVTLPESLTDIGAGAFSHCVSLTEVTIPAGVSGIGEGAFAFCSGLRSATFLGDAPAVVGENIFPSALAGEFVVFYHRSRAGWSSPQWKGYYAASVEALTDFSALDRENRNAQGLMFTLDLASGTAIVGNDSITVNNARYFGGNGGTVTVPAAVTKNGASYRVVGIGQYAFATNRLVKKVEIGANVSAVDPSAFVDCPQLAEITVNAANTRYCAQDGVLLDKTGGTLCCYPGGKTESAYTVPESVSAIGTLAFAGNRYLRDLTVSEHVGSIGRAAFGGCAALQSLTLPYIGGSLGASQPFSFVFYGRYYRFYDGYAHAFTYTVPASLSELTVTGGTLCPYAFSGCSGLEKITLPAGITAIPYEAFRGCAALRTLSFGGRAQSGVLSIPGGVTEIGERAFYGCRGFESVRLPSSLTSVGSGAFTGCGHPAAGRAAFWV